MLLTVPFLKLFFSQRILGCCGSEEYLATKEEGAEKLLQTIID